MKKKYYTFILLLPSILVNYLTLTILDVDHNLSFTSTLIVTLFNILNIFFIIFLNKINFKKLLTILTSIIILSERKMSRSACMMDGWWYPLRKLLFDIVLDIIG